MKKYKSFEDLRSEFSLPQLRKQTKNKDKLKEQRDNFSQRHICPNCKTPLSLIDGTNIMTCKNKSCKGIPYKVKNEDTGEEKTFYELSYHSLDNKSCSIANNIFTEV